MYVITGSGVGVGVVSGVGEGDEAVSVGSWATNSLPLSESSGSRLPITPNTNKTATRMNHHLL